MTREILHPHLRVRDLMLGVLALGIALALARSALVLQVQHGQPTITSIGIQISAGGLLGLALGSFLMRLPRVDRRDRTFVYAACFLFCIPGFTWIVSLLSIGLLE